MKIVLFSFLFEPELGGGAAVVVNQLAQMLVQRSFSVVVVTTWEGRFVKIEYIHGIKVIRIPAFNLYWIAEKDYQPVYKKVFWQLFDIWNPIMYRVVREILFNERPDIFHSHKLRGLSPSIWNAAKSADVKNIIHTCHDFEIMSPEGLLMGRIGNLAKEQKLVMRPYQTLRKYFSRTVQYVTAPSQFLMKSHRGMGFFPHAIPTVIFNSHNLNASELEKNILISREPKHFLYIGRLESAKGVDILGRAFSQFSNQHPGYLLRIAGWGPLEASLKEEFKQHKNIEFVGPLFGKRKIELIMDSDVLVSPSIAPESFGIVLAEAYSHGLPVIASKIGAYPEIVIHGKTGLLVEHGSVEKLSTALHEITANKQIFWVMSKNCLEFAKKFTKENFLNGYLKIYEDKIR